MKKFYTELAYVFGILSLALGTALMEKANFGMSMVVAPAYLIYLKLSEILPFFTFGMAEYAFQALLLVAMMLVLRKFEKRYLFSFVTAVVYGLVLDLFMLIVSFVPGDLIAIRIVFYLLGLLVCALGVALLFHTYISPEVYELFVKELSAKYGFRIHRCKLFYDYISCAVAVIMSFAMFGFGVFEGVKLGTIANALINGILIGWISKLLEKHFTFVDRLRKNK